LLASQALLVEDLHFWPPILLLFLMPFFSSIFQYCSVNLKGENENEDEV